MKTINNKVFQLLARAEVKVLAGAGKEKEALKSIRELSKILVRHFAKAEQ